MKKHARVLKDPAASNLRVPNYKFLRQPLFYNIVHYRASLRIKSVFILNTMTFFFCSTAGHFLTELVHINDVVSRTLIIYVVEVVKISKKKGTIPTKFKRQSEKHASHFFIPSHSL